MEILNITLDTFRNEVIGKTFLFADDTSVSIDIQNNHVTDMDVMFTVSEEKKKSIDQKMGINIIL